MFSRGLRQELHKSSVSVTCVCPGATDTEFPNRAQVGPKGLKAAEKLNMSPEAVATLATRAMLSRKAEVITGFVNKIGATLAWLLPKNLVEHRRQDLRRITHPTSSVSGNFRDQQETVS